MIEKELTGLVIGCAIRVHRELGPGLLESTYQQCLLYELHKIGLHVKSEVPQPITYREIQLDCGYRLDVLVENTLVIELKTVEILTEVHTAQILTYMRLGKFPLGLLINFKVLVLRDGIKRYIL